MSKNEAQKLELLKWIPPFLDPEKKKLIFNAAIKFHFSYCLLIWIFSRKFNKMINIIHNRSLKTVYDNTMIEEAYFKSFKS